MAAIILHTNTAQEFHELGGDFWNTNTYNLG